MEFESCGNKPHMYATVETSNGIRKLCVRILGNTHPLLPWFRGPGAAHGGSMFQVQACRWRERRIKCVCWEPFCTGQRARMMVCSKHCRASWTCEPATSNSATRRSTRFMLATLGAVSSSARVCYHPFQAKTGVRRGASPKRCGQIVPPLSQAPAARTGQAV